MGQIQERFALFVEKSGYTKQYIEKKLGLSNGYVGKIVAGRSSMSVDILENIIAIFSELNPVWLTIGEGEMLVSKKQISEQPQNIDALIEKRLDEILQKRGLV